MADPAEDAAAASSASGRSTTRREEQRKKKEQHEQQQQQQAASSGGGGGWGWGSVWSAVSDLGATLADKVIDAIDTVDGSLGKQDIAGSDAAGAGAGAGGDGAKAAAAGNEPGSLSDMLRRAREENKDKPVTQRQAAPASNDLRAMLDEARSEANKASTPGSSRRDGPPTLSDLLREARENKAGPQRQAEGDGGLLNSVAGTLQSVVNRMKDEVHITGLDELGKAIVETGVGALSSLGLQTESSTSGGDNNSGNNPNDQSILSGGGGGGAAEGRVGFQSKFENCMGMSHFEALQLLSQGLSAHLHQQLLQLSPEQYATIEGDIQHVVDCTHNSEGSSMKAPDESGSDANEKFEAMVAAFLKLDASMGPRLEKLRELRQAAHSYMQMCSDNMTVQRPPHAIDDAADPNVSTGEAEARKSVDWMEGRAEIIQEQAIVCLAELTAVFVELLRRIAEGIIVRATQSQEGEEPHTHSREDIRQRAVTLRQVCDEFVAELSEICHSFGELVLQATLLHHNKSLDASTISTDPAHSRTLATGLYLEGSAATAYVQDALQLMSPLLESLLLREAVL